MDEGATDVPPAAEKSERKFLHAHMRRNPTGKVGSSCIRQPVVSRFMLASVGSCHDLCKHGTRLVPETNKDSESTSRTKSHDSGNCGSINGENVGRREGGGSRRTAVEPKVGNEKGSMPRIISNLLKGHVNRSMKTASLRQAGSNAGKDQLDVPSVVEGKEPNEKTKLADVHEPSSFPGPSSTKKPKLTLSPPERRNIARTRSGEMLMRVPSFVSSSSQESLSFIGGKSRTMVWKGLALANKDSNPGKKLNFQRVTSFEHPSEDYSLRRLRFKRTMSREIQASSCSEYGRKNVRRVEQGGATEVKLRKRERVILRHRSMEKRQDGQRLFNKVIEETVTKLVMVRKSKVKALVGAFETVISLQDKKTKATAVAY